MKFQEFNKKIEGQSVRIIKKTNKSLLTCKKNKSKLVVINQDKYSKIKNYLNDVTDVRKIEVLLDNYKCNNNCKQCRFYYDTEMEVYKTFCNEDKTIKFALCIGSFKNNINANKKPKTNNYLVVTLVTVSCVLALITAAILFLRKHKRKNSSAMVS